jgi:hypothetical protein
LVVFVRFGFAVLIKRNAFDVVVGVDVVGSPLRFVVISDRGYIRLGLPSEMTRYIDTARLTAGIERASRMAELPAVVSGIRVPRRGETPAEVPDQTPTSPKRVRFIDRIVSYQFSGFVCKSLGCF